MGMLGICGLFIIGHFHQDHFRKPDISEKLVNEKETSLGVIQRWRTHDAQPQEGHDPAGEGAGAPGVSVQAPRGLWRGRGEEEL